MTKSNNSPTICVIADDLSGAAELAGEAFDRGLSAEIVAAPHPTTADVLVIDTDSRSCDNDEAAARLSAVGRAVKALKPATVYKKIDSVLRGPVFAEVNALLASLGLGRAVLVPANPSRGRVIIGGRYYIAGQPLDETTFADDPEYPARTADVAKLLDPDSASPIHVVDAGWPVLPAGLLVGNAASADEVVAWARRLDTATLPVGAADLFAALLAARGIGQPHDPRPSPVTSPTGRTLFVCGSPLVCPLRQSQCAANGIAFESAPPQLLDTAFSADDAQAAADRVCRALRQSRRVMLGTACGTPAKVAPSEIAARLASIVRQVLQRVEIAQLLAEGGATAAAIVRLDGWTSLSVEATFGRGIVQLRPTQAGGPSLIVKPGTYPWPRGSWITGGPADAFT